MPRAVSRAALGAVAVLTLSACGSVPEEYKEAAAIECPSGSDCFDPPKPAGPGGQITVDAGEFFFELTGGQAQEGDITVVLTNVGSAQHNFVIDEAYGGDSVPPDELLAPGETSEATLSLFAGTYTYYCAVPGHRSSGMEGTLEVLAPGAAPLPDPTGTESDPEPVGEEGAATPGEPGAPGGTEVLEPVDDDEPLDEPAN